MQLHLHLLTQSHFVMKNTMLILVALLVTTTASAQHFEIGGAVGVASYDGDLTEDFVDKFSDLGPSLGVFGRMNFNDYFNVKLGVNYGRLSGTDANSTDENRLRRNLSFRSDVFEAAVTGEFNILGYQPYALQRTFSPYLFAGVSAFYHNPKTEYNDQWVALQPLGTEGQYIPGSTNQPYDLMQVAIPVGIGFKYAINDLWNLGFEMGTRITFTDYLDDVSTDYADRNDLLSASGQLAADLANRTGEYLGTDPINMAGRQRGNPDIRDFFTFTVVSLSYNLLDNGLVGSRGRNRRSQGCPTF